MLDEGRYASIGELAAGERLDRGYLGRLLQLTLLAPDLVEAIVEGKKTEGMTLPRLMEPFAVAWVVQRAVLAGSRDHAPTLRPPAHRG